MNFSNDYKMKIATWEKKLPEVVKDDNYKWIAKKQRMFTLVAMKL